MFSRIETRVRRLLFVALLVVGSCVALVAGGQEPEPAREFAVIVHADVPREELSFAELRRIYLGDVQYWDQKGLRITLLVRSPEAAERQVLLKRVYEMSENQFRQYWIGKLFRGEVPIGPKLVYNGEMNNQLAAAIPGAIALVDPIAIPAGVKVLKIDGLRPGEPGYPIR